MDQRISRAVRFKVPHGIRSKKNECKCPVEFKNLTDDYVILYWVDFEGKPKLYGELSPINRADSGLRLVTYVTHPWVAVQGRIQVLMNGKKYFHPPNPAIWKSQKNGWMNSKWSNLAIDSNSQNEDEETEKEDLTNKHFEVLILRPGTLYILKDLIFCLLFSIFNNLQCHSFLFEMSDSKVPIWYIC